jgi:predicted RNA-binding protein associated with RNAse of E/G family
VADRERVASLGGQGTLARARRAHASAPGRRARDLVFWHGPRREFRGWYVNLQWPFRRTAHGYDTQDLELDIWLPVDGARQWKDDELLAERVREGRFTPEQVDEIRSLGRRIADELDTGGRWWDETWADWEPEPEWPTPAFSPEWP